MHVLANLDSALDKPRQHIKKQRHHFAHKGPHSQSYGFSSSYVWMWELDHNEGWVPKYLCFRIVVLEKTLESLFDWKEIKSVILKGNQPWIFIGRTDAEAPILWPPDMKSWLIEKTLILGKTEGKRRRGQHRMRWLDSITNSMDKNLSKLWETVEDRTAWPATVYRITKNQTGLSDWTTISNGYSVAHGKIYISIVLWEP